MGIRDRLQAMRGRRPNMGRQPSWMEDDSDPDADIIRNMWTQNKIIAPKSKNKERWDNLLQYVAYYFSITFPLIMAFKLNPGWGWVVSARPSWLQESNCVSSAASHRRESQPRAAMRALFDARVIEGCVGGGRRVSCGRQERWGRRRDVRGVA
eukprot:883994-Prymnesium_polylepis.2